MIANRVAVGSLVVLAVGCWATLPDTSRSEGDTAVSRSGGDTGSSRGETDSGEGHSARGSDDDRPFWAQLRDADETSGADDSAVDVDSSDDERSDATSPAPVGRHLRLDRAATGPVCRGVPEPLTFHTLHVFVETDEPLRIEALRMASSCRGLAEGGNRARRRGGGPLTRRGERLQIANDPVSDYYFSGQATCPTSPPLGPLEAELLYRVRGERHAFRFRFEQAPRHPCTAP